MNCDLCPEGEANVALLGVVAALCSTMRAFGDLA